MASMEGWGPLPVPTEKLVGEMPWRLAEEYWRRDFVNARETMEV